MEVLVAGGAGFVGAHVCKALKQQGFLPIVIDNLSTGHASFVKWGSLYQGNVSDSNLLAHIFSQHSPKVLLHFAAAIEVGESVMNPQKYVHNNVLETVALLDFLRETECKQVVFSSTAAVYQPQENLLKETDTKGPVSPYGQCKWFVEEMLRMYEVAYGFRSIIFRYFNAAGSDPEGEIGEWHQPESHLIPRILQAVRSGQPVTLFGEDYPTPDGTCIRDYVHVSDLAQAHVLAVQKLSAGGAGGVLNLGTGKGASVREIVKAVEHTLGVLVPCVWGDRREGDCAQLVADATLARAQLGWAPVYSGLEAIIRDAWKWQSSLTE